MANIKTVALNREDFEKIIKTISRGFTHNNVKHKPNKQIATILTVQANLGLRIGDVMNLTMKSFIEDGDRHRIDIYEEKTRKYRKFTVPNEIFNFIELYALRNQKKENAKLFTISERTVQRHLKYVSDYLGKNRISTHSFRKFFATEIYKNNNCDIMLVKKLLQHAYVSTTQKYIGLDDKLVEEALENHTFLPI